MPNILLVMDFRLLITLLLLYVTIGLVIILHIHSEVLNFVSSKIRWLFSLLIGMFWPVVLVALIIFLIFIVIISQNIDTPVKKKEDE